MREFPDASVKSLILLILLLLSLESASKVGIKVKIGLLLLLAHYARLDRKGRDDWVRAESSPIGY